MKFGLVGALDALLTYQGGAGIGGTIDVRQVRFADGAHVAQGMHTEIAVGVGARLASLDVQPLEFKAPHCEPRDVLVGHAQSNGHAVESTTRADRLLQLVHVFRANQVELDQSVQCSLQVGDFFGDELELVGRLVTSDDFSVTVQYETACSGNRLGANAVTL